MPRESKAQKILVRLIHDHVLTCYAMYEENKDTRTPVREPELTLTRLLNHCLEHWERPPELMDATRKRQWAMVRAAIEKLLRAEKIRGAGKVKGQRVGERAMRYAPGEHSK